MICELGSLGNDSYICHLTYRKSTLANYDAVILNHWFAEGCIFIFASFFIVLALVTNNL